MTRQEFTKFIRSLNKSDLVKIILDLTKRKKDLQDKIVLEYSSQDAEPVIDLNKVLEEFNKIPDKVFTKSAMLIGSTAVGQYCRLCNKVITTYIEPLIKNKRYYDAFYLLQAGYYSTLENLDFSLYKYSSSNSFLNKLEKDFRKILDNAKGPELVRISNLLNDNIYRNFMDPFFQFSMKSLLNEYFDSEEWENQKEEILVSAIDDYLKDFDPNQAAPDDLAECASNLLRIKLEKNASEEEIEQFVQKYRYLGDIARFEARQYLLKGQIENAQKALEEAQTLPTMSTNQIIKNSDLLIKVLSKKEGAVDELKRELVHNLDSYTQSDATHLFKYLFLLDPEKQEEAFNYYAAQPTTNELYQDRSDIESYFEVIKALTKKDYNELDKWKESFIYTLSDLAPRYVGEYFMDEILRIMENGPTTGNYEKTKEILQLLWNKQDLRDYYIKVRNELELKYKSRSRLKNIFEKIEKEEDRFY